MNHLSTDGAIVLLHADLQRQIEALRQMVAERDELLEKADERLREAGKEIEALRARTDRHAPTPPPEVAEAVLGDSVHTIKVKGMVTANGDANGDGG